MLSIGLMSGTSMDGIDAALLETDGKTAIQQIGNIFLPYTQDMKIWLKAAENATREAGGDLTCAQHIFPDVLVEYLKNNLSLPDSLIPNKVNELAWHFHQQENLAVTFSQIIRRSTELHAQAVAHLLKKTGYSAHQVDVIGYHGQTLLHKPSHKISIQAGDGKLLAALTGITVINDFRSRDIALGGEGAPFAPLYHQALALRDKKLPTAVINCGGIANITFVYGEHTTEVVGFDTGPGNGLIDRCVKQHTQGVEHMDLNGQYGLQGIVNEDMLATLYQEAVSLPGVSFFSAPPPKSLDIGDLHYPAALNALTFPDACRTLEAFTADSIVNSLHTFGTVTPKYIVLAGGGWNNPVITHELTQRVAKKFQGNIHIMTADKAGWNSQAMEAQVFAYLAVRSLHKLPISVPSTTRVPKPLTGGVLHLSPPGPTIAVEKLL